MEFERALKPFLMSISLKNETMFSVWSLESFKCYIPSNITTTIISWDIIPALFRNYILLSWIPFIVDFNICLGSLYTHIHIAIFILLSFVRLNKESSPSPANSFTEWSNSDTMLACLISFSSILMGCTLLSSYLSGWLLCLVMTFNP